MGPNKPQEWNLPPQHHHRVLASLASARTAIKAALEAIPPDHPREQRRKMHRRVTRLLVALNNATHEYKAQLAHLYIHAGDTPCPESPDHSSASKRTEPIESSSNTE